jgi:hypothetical protein
MRTFLAASLGATAGAAVATLRIGHVQRDLARMDRAIKPLAFLSSSDMRIIAKDPYSAIERRVAAVQEYEQRTGCKL